MKDEPKKDWRWVALNWAIFAVVAFYFYSLFLPDKTLSHILALSIIIGWIAFYIKTYRSMIQKLSGDARILYWLALPGLLLAALTLLNDLLFHIEVPPTIAFILFVLIILAAIPAILIYGRNRDQRKRRELTSSLQWLKQTDGGNILVEAKAEPLPSEQLKADKVKEQS